MWKGHFSNISLERLASAFTISAAHVSIYNIGGFVQVALDNLQRCILHKCLKDKIVLPYYGCSSNW